MIGGGAGRSKCWADKPLSEEPEKLDKSMTTPAIHPRDNATESAAAARKAVDILVPMDYYLPGNKAGGPVRSLANLIAALGDEFAFRILTRDRDLGDSMAYPNLGGQGWKPVGKAEVLYLSPGLAGKLAYLWQLVTVDRATVLYLYSFLSRTYSMLPVVLWWMGLCRPRCVVLAPRGEFSSGALGIHSRRKWFFLTLSRTLGLHRKVIWAASTPFEAEDIRRQFDRGGKQLCEVVLACDLPNPAFPLLERAHRKWPGELRIVLVGRVSRMKNIDLAIRMLAGLRGKVTFDIIGPVEDTAYWQECKNHAARLPNNISVHFAGAVEHEQVLAAFAAHDLMLLPTLGENFGHVIHESLAMGCPVLISDRTPWRHLEADGVGWDLPLNEPGRFTTVLQQCQDADEAWLSGVSKRARQYAFNRSSAKELINDNRNLFLLALHRTKQ